MSHRSLLRALTLVALLAALLLAVPAGADALDDLAADYWAWRLVHQPLSGDDIPRLARPAGWLPDWSAEAVASRREALADFEARFRELDASAWPVHRRVDQRLIGSALARMRWELEVAAPWRRNPLFWIDQTLGSIFDLLLVPPPFGPERAAEIVRRMAHIPIVAEQAKSALDDARAPFARLAIDALADVEERLATVARELAPLLPPPQKAAIGPAAERAGAALAELRSWLGATSPSLAEETAIGRDAYVFFLKNVALLPYTPERLIVMGRQEWERAVAFEATEANRNRGLPALALPADQAAQAAAMEQAVAEVRRFLAEREVQSVPDWVEPYLLAPLPAYLAPLSALGVNNDLTGPRRLDQRGTAYIRPPSPDNGYFDRVYALDPRTQIAHEGHGHHLQLALSWAHENPIRRHYYDSGPIEGIAFYNEELMLQAGLFDERPRTRELIYNMMRLRALRVEVDVELATGGFSIAEAADYLARTVPLDQATALQEAAFFSSSPGQAITYQIGKLQILRLLADARLQQGEDFRLRDVHDFLWKNGNVPLALLRWELLGLDDDIRAVDALR